MKKKLYIIFIILLVMTLVGCEKEKHEGEAKTPSGSSIQKGSGYLDVIEVFEKKGFTNIKAEPIEDLILGWLTKDGEVEDVSVDGDKDYKSDVWYPNDVEVIISYHIFPNEDTKDLEDDKQDTNETKDADKAKDIYGNAIGKMAIEVYNDLNNIGYSVDLKHEITKMDFSEAILYSSDPEDIESYIPWLITDLVKLDINNKKAYVIRNDVIVTIKSWQDM